MLKNKNKCLNQKPGYSIPLELINPIPTRAIFHPAFLLRSPDYKKETWEDLKEIKLKINL